MGCPTCKPQKIMSVICDEVFQMADKQPPKVCVSSLSHEYCLKDNHDGTHYVESSPGEILTAPFATGYNTNIAVGNYDDDPTVYVRTEMDKPVCYAIKTFNAGDPVQSSLWKNIRNFPIPYDYDLFFDDGCNGTDWFFQDDPVMMTANDDALFIGNYVLTPGIVLGQRGPDYYVTVSKKDADNKENVRALLECALQNSADANTTRQIQSALLLLDAAEPTPYTTNGQYTFNYADISKSTPLGDVTIKSSRRDLDSPVTALAVRFSNGLFNHSSFEINRLGMLFNYSSNCGKDSCGQSFIKRKEIDPEDRDLCIRALDYLLQGSGILNLQEHDTVKQVRDILLHPKWPPSA